MIELEECRQRLHQLGPLVLEIGRALDLDSARQELELLESQSEQEGFWDHSDRSQAALLRMKLLRGKIERQTHREETLADLITLCELALEEGKPSYLPEVTEGADALERELERARLETLLRGEYDRANAIVTFHAGAGGTEAQDWAEMLFRMYTRWSEQNGFQYRVADYLDGEEAGLKSATIIVEGEYAYGYLHGESGVHRLVRISPFDASGRRHTSFAAIEVMPEIPEDVTVDIRPDDLRVDTYRASGAGGQHVNKTSSAIRITHIPTGIVVASQAERSQFQNRDIAMRMLRSRLVEIKERENLEKISDIKGLQLKIEWGSQIRSYVFMPYTLVKDHRTGFETGNISGVMDGDLDGLMQAYLHANATGDWSAKG